MSQANGLFTVAKISKIENDLGYLVLRSSKFQMKIIGDTKGGVGIGDTPNPASTPHILRNRPMHSDSRCVHINRELKDKKPASRPEKLGWRYASSTLLRSRFAGIYTDPPQATHK